MTPHQRHYHRIVASSERDKWNSSFAFMVGVSGLPVPISEYQFLANRKFRFDFAYPDKKIGIEIEGGIYRRGGGAHSHPSNILRDIEKNNLAVLNGWRILRITPLMLQDRSAFKMIAELLTVKIQV